MQQSYVGLLIVHMLLTVASPLLYVARFLRAAPRPRGFMRHLPEVAALLLLFSGVALGAIFGQFPLREPWLTAKLVGFVAYAGGGWYLGRPGRDARERRIALAVTAAAWVYAVAVAVHQDPRAGLGGAQPVAGITSRAQSPGASITPTSVVPRGRVIS
ncbi:MAG: SirB2 family protein [Proteobacteria bacterium]|nr:SirB2 family protein [Pseudomonadota bacterium]